MAGEIEARLKALDLVLPEVALPVADYVAFLHLNGQLFVSINVPVQISDEKTVHVLSHDVTYTSLSTLSSGVIEPRMPTARVSTRAP